MEISVCVKRVVYMVLVLNCFFFTSVYGSGISASERGLSLNGLWHFKTLKDPLAEKDVVHPDSVDIKGWDALSVPGNWDTENEYASYRGLAVYRRMVELPAEWKGGIIGIRFEAVNETARVYINGHYVGSHRGGYTPFEFNVSDLVAYGAKNTVAVVVDNSYGRGAWWPWGGISRDVSLVCNQAVRITQVNVTAEPDLQTKRGQVRVKYQVENNNFQAKDLRVSAKIFPFGKKDSSIVDAQSKSLQILGMADTIQDIKLETAKAVDLWHFDHPQLYICEVAVYQRDTLLYKKRVRFGFRKIETKEGKIYLNGEAIRLMGFNRIHDHRAYGNTEPFSLIKRDLDDMKRMGCNMTRMMHAPLAPELLDYADEIGMLIMQEVPVWGREDPQAYKDNPVVR
ncbi:MAG: glycoside hydrolase family 2 protein, partial [Sphingobacterium sp.]